MLAAALLAAAPPPIAPHALTPADLESFFDGVVPLQVEQADVAGVIDATRGLNGQPKHYREVGPQLFREVDGSVHIAFVTDSSGRRTAFLDFPYEVFQYVTHPSDERRVNVVLMSAGFAIMLLTLVAWPIGACWASSARWSSYMGPGGAGATSNAGSGRASGRRVWRSRA